MKKNTTSSSKSQSKPSRPPLSQEAHENMMIGLAMDLAEEQLRNGTASAQVISHFLKMGSPKERLEREILELEKDLTKAKTDAYHAQQNMDEIYKEAIEAMRSYGATGASGEVDDDED